MVHVVKSIDAFILVQMISIQSAVKTTTKHNICLCLNEEGSANWTCSRVHAHGARVTHHFQCPQVEQNDGELDDLVDVVVWVGLLARGLEVKHTHIVQTVGV